MGEGTIRKETLTFSIGYALWMAQYFLYYGWADRRGGEKSAIALKQLQQQRSSFLGWLMQWPSLMITQLICLGFGRSGLLNFSIQ
jgi:hypothetical protein